MKHTLLATTALVAFTGAASAELSITATARIGLKTTEGSAGSSGTAVDGVLSLTQMRTMGHLETVYDGGGAGSLNFSSTSTATSAAGVTAASAATAVAQILIVANGITPTIANINGTTAAQAALARDIANMESFLSDARGAAAVATAAVADDTSAVNRIRVSFTGSGETDSGISYGATIRADNAGAGASATGGTAGSQYVSGTFGKISMGDLNGADESAAGGGVSGVGLTGLGDHSDISYQSSDHNLSYEYSASGLTFGYSQDTTVNSGSNSAMGVKYSGDMGGAVITVGVGQSKVGTSTQSTMSVSASSGGLTLKAYSSTNDNGPAGSDVTARVQSGSTTALSYRAAATGAANADTDQTALSVSYSMDSMTVTGFTKTVSTTGSADKDYSGFGFAYDMGGVTLKAGVVDNDDQQLVDFGLSFSF
jgi:outer membrane protein OmpU